MAIKVQDVLDAINLAGSTAPAFEAIFRKVKEEVFGEADQNVLQTAYDEHKRKTDSLHDQVQDL